MDGELKKALSAVSLPGEQTITYKLLSPNQQFYDLTQHFII